MEDEDLNQLSNWCSDLLTLKQREAFPAHLLIGKRSAEWVQVRELCHETGLGVPDAKPDLYAAWLPDPAGDDGYAVIIFYDEETMWTMAARYNRRRLLEGVLPATERAAEKLSNTV
jgi:hypothetical protein